MKRRERIKRAENERIEREERDVKRKVEGCI